MTRRPTRVLRVITRLNVGGPALQATLLTAGLDPERFETLLVAGKEGDHEGSMIELGRTEEGIRLHRVPSLGREISPLADLRSLVAITRIAREFRPDIVHTHLAKAGTIGRIAARLSGTRAVVHTFHGTVFEEYFGPVKSSVFIAIERGLARLSTRLVAITPRQRRELLAFGIGDEDKIVEIPLGLDLSHLLVPLDATEARRRLGLPERGAIVAIVARLVPIKNVSMFIRAIALLREPALALVIGDGEEREKLEAEASGLRLDGRVRFMGWQRDVHAIYAAADVVALTSLNEGSPVSVLEAMASSRPVVSTAVGGVPDVVTHDVSGILVRSRDVVAFAEAIDALLRDPERRKRLGAAARNAAYPQYDVSRLLADVTRLYESLVPSA